MEIQYDFCGDKSTFIHSFIHSDRRECSQKSLIRSHDVFKTNALGCNAIK